MATHIPGRPVLLVFGNPADGFTYAGPVMPNDPDLEEFTDRELRGEYWWYVPVLTLDEARTKRREG